MFTFSRSSKPNFYSIFLSSGMPFLGYQSLNDLNRFEFNFELNLTAARNCSWGLPVSAPASPAPCDRAPPAHATWLRADADRPTLSDRGAYPPGHPQPLPVVWPPSAPPHSMTHPRATGPTKADRRPPNPVVAAEPPLQAASLSPHWTVEPRSTSPCSAPPRRPPPLRCSPTRPHHRSSTTGPPASVPPRKHRAQ
jgi:hypothetical protein